MSKEIDYESILEDVLYRLKVEYSMCGYYALQYKQGLSSSLFTEEESYIRADFIEEMVEDLNNNILPEELQINNVYCIDKLHNYKQKGESMSKKSALNKQIGGTHYKECSIQPVEYIIKNDINFLEGCVIKRVTRHNKSTGKGLQDIEKAIHELTLIKEIVYNEKV